MQIEQLRFFQKTAELGSMNKAAKELFCSQPAVSAGIKTLEKELGQPLLERTTIGIELTDFGKMVLQDSNLILGYVQKWKDIAYQKNKNRAITVFLTGACPPYIFVDFIMQMRKKYPDIDIKLSHSSSASGHISFARDNNFRFGVTYRVPAHLRETTKFAEDHGMRIAILENDDFAACCSAQNDLLFLDRDLVLEDLRGREVMLYQDQTLFPYFQKLSAVNCRLGPQMWWDETMMLGLSMSDNAVAFRPRNLLNCNAYVLQGNIKVLPPIIDLPMPVHLCFLYPTKDRLMPTEEIFLEEFKAFFPQFNRLRNN